MNLFLSVFVYCLLHAIVNFFNGLFVVKKRTVPLGLGRVRRSRVRFGFQFKARGDLYFRVSI